MKIRYFTKKQQNILLILTMERKRSEGEIENTNFSVRNTDLSSLKSNLEYRIIIYAWLRK